MPGSGNPVTGDRYAVTWGPITVQPQEEDTRCVTLRLGNTTPIKVHQMRNTLSTLSHHFIVYRDNAATAESTTPTPCQPFAGTLNPQAGASPIMVTQMAEEVMTLPDRVGYSFGADQFVRLEMHFINATQVANAIARANLPGVGPLEKITGTDAAAFYPKLFGRTGIMFIQDYWRRGSDAPGRPTGDHIDVWNGYRSSAKWLMEWFSWLGYYSNYAQAKEIWFWEVK